jgi:RNA polymerase primary sigma factor
MVPTVDRLEGLPMDFAPANENDVDAWCRTAMATPPLTADQEAQLGQLVEMGDPEARERLVRANLRLVVAAARRHASDLPTLRLLQAGTEGLLYAVEAFDPASGERFAGLAGGVIEHATQRASSREGSITS